MEEQRQIQQTKKAENSLIILPKKLDNIFNADEMQLIKHVSNLTPATAFGGQMSNFVKEFRPQLLTSIEKLLAMVAVSINVGKNITVKQLPGLAEEIYQKYYFYSIDEIALVLRKGKQGEYGKSYDRLDGMIILEWFSKYDINEREMYVTNARQQLNNDYERGSINAIYEMIGQDGVKKIIEKFEKEKEDTENREEGFQSFRDKYFKENKINSNIDK